MTRSLSGWQALLLGLVVLVGAVLAGVGIFATGGLDWFERDNLHVRTSFARINGVEVGSWVRVQGMEAGKVTSIEPPAQPGDPVILHMTIKGKFRHLVRSDSVVHIISEGLIGGKGLEILPRRPRPGDPEPQPIAEGVLLASVEPTDLMDQAGDTLASIKKLAGDPYMYQKSMAVVEQGQQTLESIQRASESIQRIADSAEKLPLVGGYIENPVTLLTRSNAHRDRRVFAENDLFEPGRAVLTTNGKAQLDTIAPWLEGMKHSGSEVVVVAYADPTTANPQTARVLTRQQSEAVCEYLKGNHSIQKMGWFRSRKVTPLGQGTSPPPTPERTPLPPSRVEVIVFVPQG